MLGVTGTEVRATTYRVAEPPQQGVGPAQSPAVSSHDGQDSHRLAQAITGKGVKPMT
jgi:hypothetical protein